MPNHRPLPPVERLNELLKVVEIPEEKYGILSGLVWRVNRGPTRAGSVAGTLNKNSTNPERKDWRVKVDQVLYLASRVIYYITTGEDPGDVQVDHEDQNWLNNNAWNLRLDVDGSVRKVNSPKQRNNTSGVVGVYWDKRTKKWNAQVNENGKRKHLGYFVCKKEAANTVNTKWVELEWDKLGRKLNDLNNIQCDCGSC